MKWQRWLAVACAVAMAWPAVVEAQQVARPFTMVNRLRLEYDDNVRQTEKNPDESWKVIEEMEFWVNLNLDQSYVSLRYRPSFVWWEDRREDETDIHHDIDFVWNHAFSPRLTLSVQDTLRRAELPQLVEERGLDRIIVREDNDYLYNTLDGSLGVMVRPNLRVTTAGRYVALRYDKDEVAEREDYDLYVVGVSALQRVKPALAVGGDVRYETVEYDAAADRSSSGAQVGGALEYAFNPCFVASARVGYQQKEYEGEGIPSESAPYAEGSMTYLPSPATRLSAGVGYSMYEADVYPFANQERSKIYANIAHDFTAQISGYLSAMYTRGDYDGDDLPRNAVVRDLPPKVREGAPEAVLDLPLAPEFIEAVSDKSEDTMQVSARVTYKLNRSNWLETGLQYTKLDSDLRENYERNRIHVGWKTQF